MRQLAGRPARRPRRNQPKPISGIAGQMGAARRAARIHLQENGKVKNTMFGTQNYGGGFTQQGGASYRPQQAQQQSAEALSLDDVMQGGAPSAFGKDDPIGTSVEGEIVEIRAEQQTDFTTGEPLYYPNGKAKPQVVIHLQTTLQDPDRVGDSGIRGVYVKGYNIGQLRLACRQAGIGDHPNVGDHLKATFARTQPAKTRGYNDAKIYDYVVTPKKQSDLNAAMNDPQAGQQQYAPQQPAYGQTATIGQPAGLTASDRQTIGQLAAAGKNAQEIAGLLGKPVNQVINALGAGNRQEPEF
nr:MAG TPA: hypothetical protein [Caudoviricetes sp.]